MVKFRASGRLGILQVGYQRAVTFRSWSLTCNQEVLSEVDWFLEAVVGEAEGFWSTQPATEMRLLMQPGVWWRWKNVTVGGTPSVVGGKVEVVFRGDFEIVKG